jgi:hypothetical protein
MTTKDGECTFSSYSTTEFSPHFVFADTNPSWQDLLTGKILESHDLSGNSTVMPLVWLQNMRQWTHSTVGAAVQITLVMCQCPCFVSVLLMTHFAQGRPFPGTNAGKLTFLSKDHHPKVLLCIDEVHIV